MTNKSLISTTVDAFYMLTPFLILLHNPLNKALNEKGLLGICINNLCLLVICQDLGRNRPYRTVL